MVKKLLASLLTLVMAMSIFTFGVFNLAYAAETETAQEEIQGITADEALQIATKNAGYEVVKYPKVWEDKNADGIYIKLYSM